MSVEGIKKRKLSGKAKRKKGVDEKVSERKASRSTTAKAARKERKPVEKNEVGHRKGTILDTIYQCLKSKKGVTRQEIIEKLTEQFPDRDPQKMARTVSLQISRMPKEKGFKLEKDDKGRYRIAS